MRGKCGGKGDSGGKWRREEVNDEDERGISDFDPI